MIYGAKHGDPILQTMGNVALRENRVVIWLNVIQTKNNQFEIEDKAKKKNLQIDSSFD